MKKNSGGRTLKVVHEVLRNEHRIVVIKEDGTVEAGEWVSTSQVANQGPYYAIVGESPLPQGVFTTKEVQHSLLG